MSNPIAQWNDLCTNAVLGTERGRFSVKPEKNALGALLEKSAAEDAAGQLLKSASVLSVYRRAGTTWPVILDRVDAPSPNDATTASAMAGRLLAQALECNASELLIEWCRLAAAKGLGAPEELLPSLLTRFAHHPDTKESDAVWQVLGARGLWLAKMNQTWWFAVHPMVDPDQVWSTGTIEQRVRALKYIRSREPRRGRELLAATWAQGEQNDKTKLLPVLEVGLSDSEESFLESLLNEKTVALRRAAVSLLSRLPDSEYCKRMAERVAGLIIIKQERVLITRRTVLDVVLPESGDKAWVRDGIEFKAKGKLGAKAHALQQIMAATPLAVWEKQASPGDLLAAARKSEWAGVLLAGWKAAAIEQRNVRWAQVLASDFLAGEDAKADGADFDGLAELVRCMYPADRMQLLLESGFSWEKGSFRAIVRRCDDHWSREPSLKILASLRKHIIRTKGTFDESVRKLATWWLPLHFDPSIAEEVGNDWPVGEPYWTRWLDEMVSDMKHTLSFRKQIHEEFGS